MATGDPRKSKTVDRVSALIVDAAPDLTIGWPGFVAGFQSITGCFLLEAPHFVSAPANPKPSM
ncbi:MAG: hypothetical protein J7530_05375 [Novosphingobium sp.]|nr:hypothetical protein [Novosphingobium sp.]